MGQKFGQFTGEERGGVGGGWLGLINARILVPETDVLVARYERSNGVRSVAERTFVLIKNTFTYAKEPPSETYYARCTKLNERIVACKLNEREVKLDKTYYI